MDLHPNAATGTLRTDDGRTGETTAPRRMATDRLVLERPDDVGFDRVHALFADVRDADEVFELCGWDRHEDEARTRAYLEDRAARWEQGEFHEYVLEADGDCVGSACIEVHDDGDCEFGCWLRKPYWGRGYAAEATEALIHVAFERLGAPFVVAGCLAPNDASRRAIETFVRRFGGAYCGSPPTVSSGAGEVVPHHEWVVTRDQFAAGEQGISTLVPGVEYDDVEF